MKMNRIQTQAQKAKENGYKYIASVVKSKYATTYYNVQKIDDIINAGKWISSPKTQCGNWYGRIGQNWLPEHTILKTKLYKI